MSNNGTMPIDEVQPQPVIEVHMRWSPGVGKFEIGWPQVDDTIKIGMLGMAYASLIEARVKSAIGRPDAGLVIPVGVAPRSH